MNFKDIKTKTQFYEMADIWYQRSHKLREVWQDEQQSDVRRIKAFLTWNKLYVRLQKCTQVAFELSQPKPTPKFQKACKNVVTDFNDPAFLRGEAVIIAKPNFI